MIKTMVIIPTKKYPTIACCGLDCALCPTYYTKGSSKCPGCCGPNFSNHHPSCSIITCCVKNKKFETCAECEEFPCSKIKNWDNGDSFICHRKSLVNLRDIKANGIEKFIELQQERIKILEKLLNGYNEGRSKSFFCISTALLSLKALEEALNSSEQQIKAEKINSTDLKARSKLVKEILNEKAKLENVELKLRKK